MGKKDKKEKVRNYRRKAKEDAKQDIKPYKYEGSDSDEDRNKMKKKKKEEIDEEDSEEESDAHKKTSSKRRRSRKDGESGDNVGLDMDLIREIRRKKAKRAKMEAGGSDVEESQSSKKEKKKGKEKKSKDEASSEDSDSDADRSKRRHRKKKREKKSKTETFAATSDSDADVSQRKGQERDNRRTRAVEASPEGSDLDEEHDKERRKRKEKKGKNRDRKGSDDLDGDQDAGLELDTVKERKKGREKKEKERDRKLRGEEEDRRERKEKGKLKGREEDRSRDLDSRRDRERDADDRRDRNRDKEKERDRRRGGSRERERDRRDRRRARSRSSSPRRPRDRERDRDRRGDRDRDRDRGGAKDGGAAPQGAGGGMEDILKKLAANISAKVLKDPEEQMKAREAELAKREAERAEKEEARKKKLEKLKKWREEKAKKGEIKIKSEDKKEKGEWLEEGSDDEEDRGGVEEMKGEGVAPISMAGSTMALGGSAKKQKRLSAAGLGFNEAGADESSKAPERKMIKLEDDVTADPSKTEARTDGEAEVDPLDAFMSSIMGSEEVKNVAQESVYKGVSEPGPPPEIKTEPSQPPPSAPPTQNGTGLDPPLLEPKKEETENMEEDNFGLGIDGTGGASDGEINAFGTNVITLDEIMSGSNKDLETWESDVPESPNIEDEDAKEARYEREHKEFMEALRRKEREENRKAKLQSSYGRLYNSDGDMIEEHERQKTERNALEVLQELAKKKELKQVNHAEIDYLKVRKNLYIMPRALAKMKQEEVKALRDKMNIKIRGKGCPPPVETWDQCGFSDRILKVIEKNDFKEPFAIQKQALPAIMCGRDVIGVAKTGSGKTLAFVLPMLRHILDQPPLAEGEGPIGLIMAPARELAFQIYDQARKFTKLLGLRVTAVYGGAGIADQIGDLKRGADIVVCTPGRMIDILTMQAGKLVSFQRVSFVVMDEADRMFDMGFEPQIRMILQNVRPDRQTVLFSATFPRQVEQLARKVLKYPLEIIVGGRSIANDNITQYVEVREEDDKYMRLLQLLGIWFERGSILIFVDTQQKTDVLFKDLQGSGYPVLALHGGMDQADRDFTIDDFKKGVGTVLIATSVAGRGLDVPECRCVINYSCPNHLEDYVHRVGRTGRAGRKGTAYTFICPKEEDQYAPLLVKALTQAEKEVPKELQELCEEFKAKVDRGEARWASSGFTNTKGFTFEADEMTEKQKMDEMAKKQFLADQGILDEEEDIVDSDDEEPAIIARMKEEEEKKKGDVASPAAAPVAVAPAVPGVLQQQGLLPTPPGLPPIALPPGSTPQQVAQAHLQAALSGQLGAQVPLADAAPPPPPVDVTDPKALLKEMEGASPLEKAKRLAAAYGKPQPQPVASVLTSGGIPIQQLNLTTNATPGLLGVAPGVAQPEPVLDQAQALDKARAIIANLMPNAAPPKQPEKPPSPTHFETEISINEYPQQARFRVQHKDTINRVEDECGVSVITRGIYCPPGKRPHEEHGKLRLFLEGPSVIALQSAKKELQRVLNEETMRAGLSQSYGKYSVL